jgi:SAM-dependent methyltransferase
MNDDKAGKLYWDHLHRSGYTPQTFNPQDPGLKNYVSRRLHAHFSTPVAGIGGKRRLLEIGCGGSGFLPYFAKEFRLDVAGIDYSEAGCALASRLLSLEGVSGDVVCGDFFRPPAPLLEAFDLVLSFGVAEHFTDTSACLAAFSKFLRPGGTLVTIIPNMVGVTGRLQKLLDGGIYDKHIPLDKNLLQTCHQQAGLSVIWCDYLVFNSFWVINMNGVRPGTAEWYLKRPLLRLCQLLSGALWFVDEKFGPLTPTRFGSAYIGCTAEKPVAP